MARPHSAPRGRVWDVAIELLVTQESNWLGNPAKVRLVTLLH